MSQIASESYIESEFNSLVDLQRNCYLHQCCTYV